MTEGKDVCISSVLFDGTHMIDGVQMGVHGYDLLVTIRNCISEPMVGFSRHELWQDTTHFAEYQVDTAAKHGLVPSWRWTDVGDSQVTWIVNFVDEHGDELVLPAAPDPQHIVTSVSMVGRPLPDSRTDYEEATCKFRRVLYGPPPQWRRPNERRGLPLGPSMVKTLRDALAPFFIGINGE